MKPMCLKPGHFHLICIKSSVIQLFANATANNNKNEANFFPVPSPQRHRWPRLGSTLQLGDYHSSSPVAQRKSIRLLTFTLTVDSAPFQPDFSSKERASWTQNWTQI